MLKRDNGVESESEDMRLSHVSRCQSNLNIYSMGNAEVMSTDFKSLGQEIVSWPKTYFMQIWASFAAEVVAFMCKLRKFLA